MYRVIYDAIEDIKAALEGLLRPELQEEITGTAEIRQVFKVPKVGKVAGCYVLSGKLRRADNVRLYREDKLIYEGKLGSLKRFKDDVREVQAGFECGLSIEGFDDIHVGDVVECFQVTEIKRSLD
ncbi:MAG: EF-Tu/IF-2/RF-3 family GTPase [candidate division KSB1 bacterium]|nr:EF-Tu/IF-2/RF-3 family GTPase [candidate division KSB1 bacterium]